MVKYIFIVGGIICAISILMCAAKSKRPLRFVIFSVLLGLITFAIASICGKYFGISLPVNLWTLGYSAVAGVPGVVFMIAIKLIWNL